MNSAMTQLAAPSGLISLVLFVVAVAVLGLLAGGFWITCRIKDSEPPRPSADEQPHLPPEGATREVQENREPDEIPRTPKGGRALLPYELTNMGTKTSENKDRPRWSRGSSGSFGGGGLGAH
ncbi:DUF6479 family protein [Streptomyces sp. NPDC046860]|uniref:DUF6479 family protein n=1 Tax=Streptomyces sp. NPDC046860 TaxID=3154495 RepID=UPI003411B649